MVRDLTVGSPGSILWCFCLPMFGSIVFQQLYNIADSLVSCRIKNGLVIQYSPDDTIFLWRSVSDLPVSGIRNRNCLRNRNSILKNLVPLLSGRFHEAGFRWGSARLRQDAGIYDLYLLRSDSARFTCLSPFPTARKHRNLAGMARGMDRGHGIILSF